MAAAAYWKIKKNRSLSLSSGLTDVREIGRMMQNGCLKNLNFKNPTWQTAMLKPVKLRYLCSLLMDFDKILAFLTLQKVKILRITRSVQH